MESQIETLTLFEIELSNEINKLNEMKEKIERKKREIENMVSKSVENSTEVVQKKRGRPKKIIDKEKEEKPEKEELLPSRGQKPEKPKKKMGRPSIYVTDEQKREWYNKRKEGMKVYYKNNRERLDKLNYQAMKKRMKIFSLVSKDEDYKKMVEEKG